MTLALAICGADDEERALLEQFCKAAAAEWTARLRPGIAEGSCEEALTCAAALRAAGRLLAARAGQESVSSFQAGQVSFHIAGAAERSSAAAVLEAQAQALMEPYIRDDRFCFRGVPG